MTTRRRIAWAALVVAWVALASFAIGRHYGRIDGARKPSWSLRIDQPRSETWLLIAIPPCASDTWSEEAVGLTYAETWRHARDLVPPDADYQAHPHPFKNGATICPGVSP